MIEISSDLPIIVEISGRSDVVKLPKYVVRKIVL